MRILYIASATFWGGASVALYNLIKELKCKHEILVLFPSNEGRFCDELDKIGVEYTYTPYNLNIYPVNGSIIKRLYIFLRTIYRNRKARKYVYNLIIKFKPDIVHNNVGPLNISFGVCQKLGIPHVWHQREYQDLDFNFTYIPCKKSYQKTILKCNNYNIAITKGIYEHWNLRTNLDQIIYDGVFDKDMFKSNKDLPKENYFLFVGRVEKAKGTLDAIKAYNLFNKKYQNYRLLVAGRHNPAIFPYCKECEEYVKEHNLEQKVFFLGEVTNVFELMSKAQALLVPSLSEGFGFITVEAMLNHCVVLGRNTSGTKEQFDNGLKQTGSEIGFRFTNIDELVQSMFYVVENDLSKVRELAFRVVLNNYSSQKHAEKVECFYEEILSNFKS